MYDNGYEDYMRSVLGYPYANQNMYNTYGSMYENTGGCFFPYRSGTSCNLAEKESKFENMYPEIYKILKPMVKKACSNNIIDEISNDDIDIMTDDIYTNVCSDIDVVNINVTAENPRRAVQGKCKSK